MFNCQIVSMMPTLSTRPEADRESRLRKKRQQCIHARPLSKIHHNVYINRTDSAHCRNRIQDRQLDDPIDTFKHVRNLKIARPSKENNRGVRKSGAQVSNNSAYEHGVTDSPCLKEANTFDS